MLKPIPFLTEIYLLLKGDLTYEEEDFLKQCQKDILRLTAQQKFRIARIINKYFG